MVPIEIYKCVLQIKHLKTLKRGPKKGIRKMEVPSEEPVTSREAKITCIEIK